MITLSDSRRSSRLWMDRVQRDGQTQREVSVRFTGVVHRSTDTGEGSISSLLSDRLTSRSLSGGGDCKRRLICEAQVAAVY